MENHTKRGWEEVESRILLTVWKSEYVNQETVEGECNPICMRP